MKADVVVVKVEPGDVVEAGQVSLVLFNPTYPLLWNICLVTRLAGGGRSISHEDGDGGAGSDGRQGGVFACVLCICVCICIYVCVCATVKHSDAQVKATHVVVGDKVDAEDLLVELE